MLASMKAKTLTQRCHGTMEIMTLFFIFFYILTLAGIYLFKVNNRSTSKMLKICSKLTLKKPDRPKCRFPGVFIVNFEQISHIVLMIS